MSASDVFSHRLNALRKQLGTNLSFVKQEAENLLRQFNDDPAYADEYAQSLLLLGECEGRMGLYNDAFLRLNEAKAHFQSVCDLKSLADAENALGMIYSIIALVPQAHACFERALALYQTLNDKRGEAMVHFTFSTVSDCSNALISYQNARLLASELGDEKLEANILSNIGITISSLGNYAQALDILFSSLSISRRLNDQYSISFVLQNLAYTYQRLNEPRQSLAFLDEAFSIAQSLGAARETVVCLHGIGATLIQLHDYSNALARLEEALHHSKSIGDNMQVALILIDLAIACKGLNENARAYRCLIESFEMLRASGNRYHKIVIYLELGKLFSAGLKFTLEIQSR